MDLNQLYSQHQLSLMRATAAISRLARTRHLAAAGLVANRIRDFQLESKATASAGWLCSMNDLDWSGAKPPACAL